MKKVILFVFIGYLIAVGYNTFSINNMKENVIMKNKDAIVLEVVKRLNPGVIGLIGGLLSGDITSALGGEERFARETLNVIYDWYAPIKLVPISSLSKEINYIMLKDEIIKMGR
jgi:hypothetical protein